MPNTILLSQDNIEYTTDLVVEICCNCFVPFAMPSSLQRQRRKDHEMFYCPNGHAQHYVGKTEEQKLRDRLKNTERLLDSSREAYAGERTRRITAERSATAYKGVATKARQKAGRGVCPVEGCKRTVRQLADHMSTEHPDYAASEVTPDGGTAGAADQAGVAARSGRRVRSRQ